MYPRSTSSCFLVPFVFILTTCIALLNSSSAQIDVTVDATQLRSVGGISELDRTRFFNHHGTLAPPSNTNLGNLANELWSPAGLNTSTGRTGTEFDQFIAQNLPEDSSRPSFIDPVALVNKIQGDYRNFVVAGTRWRSLRENPDSMFINAGRAATFWPSFFRTDPNSGVTSNHFPHKEAYAEFLNIYLEEAVYGPNAFLPMSADRFHIEVINEPDLHLTGSFTAQDLAAYHRDISQSIKSNHPLASVGGPSQAITSFEDNSFARWFDIFKPFMDIAGADMDFYSIHPYERYDVQNDGSHIRAVDQSPGRVNGTIDLIQNYQEVAHGNRLPIAFTEYGAFNFLGTDNQGNPTVGNYTRDLQQWDLVRDVKEKLMVYINRPDTILSATPFVSPIDWRNETPTSIIGENIFFERVANGDWQETIIANMFRCFSPIQGDYIGVDCNDDNLQTVAFRDGNTVYLMLSNLSTVTQTLNLDVMAGQQGSVSSASVSRVYRDNGQNFFDENVDVTSTYQNFMMNPEELVVATFQLTNPADVVSETNEETYYSDMVVSELNVSSGRSPVVNINVPAGNIIESTLRITYSRPSNSAEAFDIDFNGSTLSVNAETIPHDDGDLEFIVREINVPTSLLVDGNNTVQVDFSGNGGHLSTAALVVKTLEVAPEASLDSFEFTEGDFAIGTIADLNASDNSDVSGRRSNTDIQSRVFLEVKGTTTVAVPSSLSFTLEASVFARTTVNQTIDFYNYDQNIWETIVSGTAMRFVDSVMVANANGNLSRFIEDGTGCVEVRCRFQSSDSRQRFTANIDHGFWTINP